MRFCKWILAASAPLVLASCVGGGSGGGAQSAAVQSLLENATNLEMTNRYLGSGNTIEIACSGTVCETFGGNGNYSLAAYHSAELRLPSLSGPAGVGNEANLRYRQIRRLGQHSGYYSVNFRYANTGIYYESFSAAFGGPERKPVSGTGTWTGDMGGHEVRSGIQLTGKSTITYSFGDNTAAVRLYDISGSGYFGDDAWYFWDMTVNNDGSFFLNNPDYPGQYVAGNFYGPNAEETTGIFENGALAGAWFADR